jgi:uncharacterized membrane protein
MFIVETIADLVDALAVCVLLVGLAVSSFTALRGALAAKAPRDGEALQGFRISLGRWLLAALEILIVSDILHSVVHRTLEEVAFLAGIVVIRTTLSYFLDHEIERMERLKTQAAPAKDFA